MTRKKPKATRTPADKETRIMEGPIVEIPDALAQMLIDSGQCVDVSEAPRSTDATAAVQPIGRRLDKGFVWEIEPGWTERVERMADAAGLPPEKFLDSILRRAWIALPMSKRGGA